MIYIEYMYGVFSVFNQEYTPLTSDFLVLLQRPRRKNPRFRGYVVGYSPQKYLIYSTYILMYTYIFKIHTIYL